MEYTRLSRYGCLEVSGADAREFLHAQLTNDVRRLPADRAELAGWCSAKGRLLASFLVIPRGEGFLLQLSRDLAVPVAKRLSMFVLRSKVKVIDASAQWTQLGVWGELPGLALAAEDFAVSSFGAGVAVRAGSGRLLVFSPDPGFAAGTEVAESRWSLEEIRAGRPLITGATQELFVPQMVNLHTLGGVDFRKGCYPGQEVVARTQYRGQLKRHMIHASIAAGAQLAPGAAYEGGTVVDAAPSETGTELLAVVPLQGE